MVIRSHPRTSTNDTTNHGSADGASVGGNEDANSTSTIDLAAEDSDKSPVASMLQYFKSIATETMAADELEAISIIRDHINNNDDDCANIIPADLFTNSKSSICKAITKLLSERINEADWQSRVGDAALKKWFKAPNTKRAFMY